MSRHQNYQRVVARLSEPGSRYELLGEIGRGGMGVVYKVYDRELEEILALKVLRSAHLSDDAIQQFKNELKLARRINHPNVARVHDMLVWNDQLAISQEFIDGQPLAADATHLLPVSAIVRYMRYICSALQAAHDMGIVHRDLKPSNLLIDERDRPRVVDFGLAVIDGQLDAMSLELIVGSPWYMPPELVIEPQQVAPQSDIYSLGVVLFQLVTGRTPFVQRTVEGILRAHVQEVPPRPSNIASSAPAYLDDIILRCLSKDKRDRYPSMRALYHELLDAYRAHSSSMPAPTNDVVLGRVLVVEDDDDIRAWTVATLHAFGCDVLEAPNGLRGVEVALAGKPSLILLDIIMPELDGREVLRILKSNPVTRSIPVVMVTSLSDEEEALLSHETGAAMFLNKPIQRDVLQLLIERYLGVSAPHLPGPGSVGKL